MLCIEIRGYTQHHKEYDSLTITTQSSRELCEAVTAVQWHNDTWTWNISVHTSFCRSFVVFSLVLLLAFRWPARMIDIPLLCCCHVRPSRLQAARLFTAQCCNTRVIHGIVNNKQHTSTQCRHNMRTSTRWAENWHTGYSCSGECLHRFSFLCGFFRFPVRSLYWMDGQDL